MTQSIESFRKSWDGHIEELVNVSAKKAHAIEGKHRQIVEGACRVFFKKGFHPTSIREIAEAANMSMGQLYHYISSKDDVLFLIHKHMHTTWYHHLMDSQIEEIEDPSEKLAVALRSTFEFLVKNKRLIQFVYTESKYLNKEHLRVVLEMDDKNVVEFWRELLRKASEGQEIEVDTDLAANLIAFVMVFFPLRGWNLRSKPLKEVSKFLTDFVFRGIGLETS